MNKKGFEFGFSWLFAIIVGAAIIFLAIYGVNQLIKTNKDVSNTETSFQLNNLLTSVVTNLETTKTSKISFNQNTRVYNKCDTKGNFGFQQISTSTESGIGNKWQTPIIQATSYDKYIFSSSIEEGKVLELFPKAFKMPFKIADLVFLWNENDNFCFVNPPNDIKDDLSIFNSKSINITDDVTSCKRGSKRVCFGSGDCEIIVEQGRVKKDGKILYYYDSLVYGAIFSSPDVYECQVKRLMKRSSELALLYRDKTNLLSASGCNSGLDQDLLLYSNLTFAFNTSADFINVVPVAEEMSQKNELLNCALWGEK